MWRCLLYILPILSNTFCGGMFFITAYRFSEAGAHKLLVTGTMATWGLLYSLLSILVGKTTTPRRAPYLVTTASFTMLVCALGFAWFPNLYLQYLWISIGAVAFALYCVPFQVFSKDLESTPKDDVKGDVGIDGAIRAAALYTMAWSFGLASGQALFGSVSVKAAFTISAILPMAMLLCIFLLQLVKHRRQPMEAAAPAPDSHDGRNPVPQASHAIPKMPDLARVGWIGGALGTIVITIYRSLEPNLAVQHEIPKLHAGLILALVSYTQVVMGFLALFGKKWMYSAKAFLAIGLVGCAGLGITAAFASMPLLYLGSLLTGIFSGLMYFMFTFHSMVHPTQNAYYLSINETLVGIASIIGPILGGFMAQYAGLNDTFWAAAAIVVVMGILQFIGCTRVKRKI